MCKVNRASKGFSLIELMIVVAIVGILAGIAYPSYQAQMRDTRRGDGQAALMQLSQFMQRFFTENGRFDVNTNGDAVDLPFIQAPRDGDIAFYTLSLADETAGTYILQAVPVAGGPQAGDHCGTMTLSNTGAKTAAVAGCW